jgi:C4-dicarboxylate-binding protein DctP
MPEISLRIGGYQPARSVHTRAMRVFIDGLNRRLGDRVAVAYTENVTAAGRKAVDLLPMTEGDEIDVCYIASSSLVERVPSLGVFDLPFHFTDRNAAYALADGPAGRRLSEDVAAATGFAVLAYWDNGFRHFSNGVRRIVHPRDCRGLKLRTLENAQHHRVFRAFGFEPVVIGPQFSPRWRRRPRRSAALPPQTTNRVSRRLNRTPSRSFGRTRSTVPRLSTRLRIFARKQ